MSNTEVEGKLIIASDRPAEVAERLAALDSAGEFALTDRQVHQIGDVYFDTPARDLAIKSIALRVRVEDGQEKLTLKGESQAIRDVRSRLELELDWSPAAYTQIVDVLSDAGVRVGLPPLAPGMTAEDALKAGGLRPSTARTNRRTALAVIDRLGRRVAELAIDDVTFLTADLAVRHFEIECEAKGSGNSEAVQRLLDALRLDFPELQPFEYSKLDIAEALNRLAASDRLQSLLADSILKPSAYETIRRVLHESGARR